jgi:hypothetical protein
MTITYQSFIAVFPEFKDPELYTEAQFSFWSGQAYLQLNPRRLSDQLDTAAMFFVGHYLVLSARAQAAAKAGGIPGEVKGPPSSKGIGPVSAGFDTNAVTTKGADFWNGTTYGTALYKLLQSRAAGPAYAPGNRWARGRLMPWGLFR